MKVASLIGYESAAAFNRTFKKRLASRRENIGNWPVNWTISVAVNFDGDLWLSARPRFARFSGNILPCGIHEHLRWGGIFARR